MLRQLSGEWQMVGFQSNTPIVESGTNGGNVSTIRLAHRHVFPFLLALVVISDCLGTGVQSIVFSSRHAPINIVIGHAIQIQERSKDIWRIGSILPNVIANKKEVVSPIVGGRSHQQQDFFQNPQLGQFARQVDEQHGSSLNTIIIGMIQVFFANIIDIGNNPMRRVIFARLDASRRFVQQRNLVVLQMLMRQNVVTNRIVFSSIGSPPTGNPDTNVGIARPIQVLGNGRKQLIIVFP
mmetsp:Transcript_1204/g.1538  ORF Transcript_1204/g.1538 Transcript_1204/m.1538 type:complete len:238 (-) Transcript_1204:1158-1871(-)